MNDFALARRFHWLPQVLRVVIAAVAGSHGGWW